MSKYFLWLTSDGESRDRLAQLIHQLSEQYRGPKFDPHITLLGEIEGEESRLIERVGLLAKKLRSLSIDLQQPAFEDEYFRCLYFPVKKTPELIDAHEQAKVILDKTSVLPFYPHVSLLYGLLPLGVKEDIIASLPSDIPNPFSVTTLTLVQAKSTKPQDWLVTNTFALSMVT